MINALEYLRGSIQVKIDGHRHVLESAKSVDIGGEVTESRPDADISNELPLVKSAALAVFSLATRSKGVARFNPQTGLIKWNGQILTPESALGELPEDIAAFATAMRTPETIATFNSLKPVEYVMEDYEDARIKNVDGAPTLVAEIRQRPKTKRVRVKNEDGTLAFDKPPGEKGRKALYANVPILKKS